MDVFDKPEYNYLIYARNESFLMYKLCSNNSVRIINLIGIQIESAEIIKSRFLMMNVSQNKTMRVNCTVIINDTSREHIIGDFPYTANYYLLKDLKFLKTDSSAGSKLYNNQTDSENLDKDCRLQVNLVQLEICVKEA